MICYTCGEISKRRYCSKRCSIKHNTIYSKFYEDRQIVSLDNTISFIKQYDDKSPRQLKDILYNELDILKSLYNYINWTDNFSEIIYCIRNEIFSKPKCKICDEYVNYGPCKGTNRYSNYCVKHRTYEAKKQVSKNLKIAKDNQNIVSKEELILKLKSYTKRFDHFSKFIIVEGLYNSLLFHTNFFDNVKNRKVNIAERIHFLLNDLVEIPKCIICNTNYVKPTTVKHKEQSYKYMDFCSEKCMKKISVLRNKTDEEMRLITFKRIANMYNKTDEEKNAISLKRKKTIENKTDEEKALILEKIYQTKKKNNSYGASKISQELFWELEKYINEKEFINFHELNNEKTIRHDKKHYRVDFCYKNKVIEFLGDHVHGSPYLYRDDGISKYHYYKNKPIIEKWEEDYNRINNIISEGFSVKMIWSGDYVRQKEAIIQECLKFLNLKGN